MALKGWLYEKGHEPANEYDSWVHFWEYRHTEVSGLKLHVRWIRDSSSKVSLTYDRILVRLCRGECEESELHRIRRNLTEDESRAVEKYLARRKKDTTKRRN